MALEKNSEKTYLKKRFIKRRRSWQTANL